MKILSIIIPSYNTEKFIEKNIPTFLDESILDDIEILMINDGSRDNTEAVAKKYEKLYPNTVRVISKENGGHGSVINKGIEIAEGKYYKVVDGDDWVETANLCKLIEDLKTQDADLIINSYFFVYENTGKKKLVDFETPSYGEKYDFNDIATMYQKLPIHSITFKTSILRENNIRVREKCFYEDNEYDLFPIPFVETVVVYNYPVYNYLIAQKDQSVSDTNSLKNHQMFYTVIKDCIEAFELHKEKLSSNKRIYMMNTILEILRSQYNIYLRNGLIEDSFHKLKEFDMDLKLNYPNYYENVAKKYKYIGLAQKQNKILFYCLTVLMILYKKMTMR